jgi:hypothetical protein
MSAAWPPLPKTTGTTRSSYCRGERGERLGEEELGRGLGRTRTPRIGGPAARVSTVWAASFIPHSNKYERPRSVLRKIRRPRAANRCESPYGGHLLYLLISVGSERLTFLQPQMAESI